MSATEFGVRDVRIEGFRSARSVGVRARPRVRAGPGHTVMLSPDFEAVARLHGHRHKPARAWQRFSTIDPGQVPAALRHLVEAVLELAA